MTTIKGFLQPDHRRKPATSADIDRIWQARRVNAAMRNVANMAAYIEKRRAMAAAARTL